VKRDVGAAAQWMAEYHAEQQRKEEERKAEFERQQEEYEAEQARREKQRNARTATDRGSGCLTFIGTDRYSFCDYGNVHVNARENARDVSNAVDADSRSEEFNGFLLAWASIAVFIFGCGANFHCS
jgi:hypothetical protein